MVLTLLLGGNAVKKKDEKTYKEYIRDNFKFNSNAKTYRKLFNKIERKMPDTAGFLDFAMKTERKNMETLLSYDGQLEPYIGTGRDVVKKYLDKKLDELVSKF